MICNKGSSIHEIWVHVCRCICLWKSPVSLALVLQDLLTLLSETRSFTETVVPLLGCYPQKSVYASPTWGLLTHGMTLGPQFCTANTLWLSCLLSPCMWHYIFVWELSHIIIHVSLLFHKTLLLLSIHSMASSHQ